VRPVQSTDAVVHELYEGARLRDAVSRAGEKRLWVPDGKIDRAAGGQAGVCGRRGRAWLEATIWPMVGETDGGLAGADARAAPAPRATVVEVPLLFEAGMEGLRRDDCGRGERAAARAARRESGHALTQERARVADPGGEGAKGNLCRAERRHEEDLERELSGVLDKLGR